MPDYAPGTPSWVELSSPDPDASVAFYGDVLGWSATEPGPAETGGYRMFQCDGKNVAGLMGHMQEGQPTAWATYISVADADEAARKVQAAGGTQVVSPMDVMDLGRMAVFADPTGAVFGVWEPRAFAGADLVNEPVSLVWNEVHTHDTEAGKAFYEAVFGWSAGKPSFEGAPDTYTVWQLQDHNVGGMMEMVEGMFPPDTPPHWSVCFAVADAEDTVAKAREHGGSIAAEPVDMPIGRFAAIVDPQGAAFTIMQPAAASS
jgi:predicted enzyme related to lactoylglutathione lyase